MSSLLLLTAFVSWPKVSIHVRLPFLYTHFFVSRFWQIHSLFWFRGNVNLLLLAPRYTTTPCWSLLHAHTFFCLFVLKFSLKNSIFICHQLPAMTHPSPLIEEIKEIITQYVLHTGNGHHNCHFFSMAHKILKFWGTALPCIVICTQILWPLVSLLNFEIYRSGAHWLWIVYLLGIKFRAFL